MIDPQDPAAFTGAKLVWDEVGEPSHASMLELYRELLRLRREFPELADPRLDQVQVDFDEDERWLLVHRGSLLVAANLAAATRVLSTGGTRLLLSTGAATVLSADQVSLAPQSAAIIQR
jgi:maltooligosyltrehalose trehalohydrolase